MPLIPSPSDYIDPVAVGPTAVTAPSLAPPGTVGAGASWTSALSYADGFAIVALAATLAAAGTLSCQRYLDIAGTIPQGGPVSVALASGVPNQLIVNDGLPFQSFTVSVANSSGGAAALSFYALLSAQELRHGNVLAPALDLNYAATPALVHGETFTRASPAWSFGTGGSLLAYSTGVARFDGDVASPDVTAPHNLLQYSADATKWTASNGSGGTASTATQITWSGAGGMGLKLDGAGGAYALEPNTTYTVFANVQLVTGTNQMTFRLYSDTAVFQESAPATITGTVASYTATFTTPATVNPANASLQLQWTTNGTWNVTSFALLKGGAGGAALVVATNGTYVPPGDLTNKTVAHNLAPNSAAAGAVAGAPGTPPTGWSAPSTIVGAARTIATGTLADGTPYVDLSYTGTSSGPGVLSVIVAQAMPCALGQTLYGSLGCSVVAGDMTGFSTWKLAIIERDAANAANASAVIAQPFPPNGTVTGQRTVLVPTTVKADLRFDVAINAAGAAINVTFRITAPQVARGSSVPYVATSGTAVAPTYPALGYRGEDAKTNSLRNSSAGGSTPGTPGTTPTFWTPIGGANGLATQVVGSGTEDGIPYVDYRIFGTTTAAGSYGIAFDTRTQIAAVSGQTWASSFFCRQVNGTQAGITSLSSWLAEQDVGGATLGTATTAVLNVTAGPLKTQRNASTRTLNQATVASVINGVLVFFPISAVIDVTLRLGAPQLEQGTFASTPILTTSAAVARAVDLNMITGANVPAALQGAPAGFTLMVAGRTSPAMVPAIAGNFLQLDDGSNTNRFWIRRTQGGGDPVGGSGVAGGVSQQLLTFGSPGNNADFKAWYAAAANDVAGALAGGATQASASNTMPTGLSRIVIGGFSSGSADGTVKHVSIYAKRVPTATAIGLAAQL